MATSTPPPRPPPPGVRRDVPATPYSFVCGDKTLTWESSWYTEAFYTESTAYYSDRAQYGPVYVPWSAFANLAACSPPLTATYIPSLTATSNPAALATTTDSSSIPPAPSAVASPSPPAASDSSAAGSSASLVAPSGSSLSSSSQTTTSSILQTVTETTSASVGSPGPSSSTIITAGITTTIYRNPSSSLPPLATISSNSSIVANSYNAHTGAWDSQAKGVVFVTVFAVIFGALVWAAWFLLCRPFSLFFAPRSWFLSSQQRAPLPSLAALLTPFNHLPSLASPTGEATVATHVQAGALSMAAVGAILGLAVFLPLMIAGVPHLSDTSPPNSLGGRLGSLIDLSILRLLNAHHPSSETQTRQSIGRRALATTIKPALTSARGRLIALAILSGAVWVGACLYIVRRTYNKLYKYAEDFEDACAGQQMVFLPNEPGWAGKSEAEIKQSLSMLCQTEGESIACVFSAGHLLTLRALINERDHVHGVLETSETKYIESLVPDPTGLGLNHTTSSNSSLGLNSNTCSTNGTDQSHLVGTDFSPMGSVFLEVQQRSSVIRHKGKLMIGQKIIQDEDGTFIPAPENEASSSQSPFLDPPVQDGASTQVGTPVDVSDPFRQSIVKDRESTLRDSPFRDPTIKDQDSTIKERPLSDDSEYAMVEKISYEAEPTARLVSQLTTPDLNNNRINITWSRARLTKLNAQVNRAQTLALTSLTKGTGEVPRIGCIVVGRGVRSLPNAVDIPGCSKEDILWDNLGERDGTALFWVKVVAVSLVAAGVCLPFLGLAVASAPGVSSRLNFLAPLSMNNGLGSGIASGLIAALAIVLILTSGVRLIERVARDARPVSYMTLQALSVKATFYFLLVTGTLVFILIGALIFAVQPFHSGVQMGRGVGDGAVYISFLSLTLLIGICILVPGLLILHPVSFIRWYLASRKAVTPRERFRVNRPPTFNPTVALAPLLIGFFHVSALAGLAPLLVVPALILAYLTLVSACWLSGQVFIIRRGGPSNGRLGLWLIRRLGWAVCLQPAVLGLVLLSRREWAAGALGIAFAVLGLVASEVITYGMHRTQPEARFLERADLQGNRRRTTSGSHSLLSTLYTMLPGLSRLPDSNPLPLPTDAINDMAATEHAAFAMPNVSVDVFEVGSNVPVVVMGPHDDAHAFVYPPELTMPAPTIWLPRDRHGFAQTESESLAAEGIEVFIDPLDRSRR